MRYIFKIIVGEYRHGEEAMKRVDKKAASSMEACCKKARAAPR
jgi:hypothetical protein